MVPGGLQGNFPGARGCGGRMCRGCCCSWVRAEHALGCGMPGISHALWWLRWLMGMHCRNDLRWAVCSGRCEKPHLSIPIPHQAQGIEGKANESEGCVHRYHILAVCYLYQGWLHLPSRRTSLCICMFLLSKKQYQNQIGGPKSSQHKVLCQLLCYFFTSMVQSQCHNFQPPVLRLASCHRTVPCMGTLAPH